MTQRPDLVALATPFKDHQVKTKPGGFGARPASTPRFSSDSSTTSADPQRVVQTIRADGQVHGVILEMTFSIDGRDDIVIQEAGDCERPDRTMRSTRRWRSPRRSLAAA